MMYGRKKQAPSPSPCAMKLTGQCNGREDTNRKQERCGSAAAPRAKTSALKEIESNHVYGHFGNAAISELDMLLLFLFTIYFRK